MFVINGSDYTIPVIVTAVALALFLLQYVLCRKAKYAFLKLIPAFIIAVPFALALICLIETGGGFIDVSNYFAAVFGVIGGIWTIFAIGGWLFSKIKRS